MPTREIKDAKKGNKALPLREQYPINYILWIKKLDKEDKEINMKNCMATNKNVKTHV